MNIDLINHIAATIRRADGGHMMSAATLAEAIVADLPTGAAEADVSPWPLAEGDRVRITLDAEVFARPDPEDEPGEDYWTFAITVAGERVLLDGMLPAEVAERVRKAGDR